MEQPWVQNKMRSENACSGGGRSKEGSKKEKCRARPSERPNVREESSKSSLSTSTRGMAQRVWGGGKSKEEKERRPDRVPPWKDDRKGIRKQSRGPNVDATR